jgi:hypothetical protein
MISSRFIVALYVILTMLPAYGQSRGEVPLFKTHNDGKVIDYSISPNRAEKLPKWDPTQPAIPLQLHEAVAKAQSWIKKQNPKIDSYVPNRIELGRVSYGRFFGLWYYTVGFDGVVGGQRMHGSGLQAVVLMDGSIVEPQPDK